MIRLAQPPLGTCGKGWAALNLKLIEVEKTRTSSWRLLGRVWLHLSTIDMVTTKFHDEHPL